MKSNLIYKINTIFTNNNMIFFIENQEIIINKPEIEKKLKLKKNRVYEIFKKINNELNNLKKDNIEFKNIYYNIYNFLNLNSPIDINDTINSLIKNQKISKENTIKLIKIFMLMNDSFYIYKKNNIHFICKEKYSIKKNITKATRDKITKLGFDSNNKNINVRNLNKKDINNFINIGYFKKINYVEIINNHINKTINNKGFICIKKSTFLLEEYFKKNNIPIKLKIIEKTIKKIIDNENFITIDNFSTFKNIDETIVIKDLLKSLIIKDKISINNFINKLIFKNNNIDNIPNYNLFLKFLEYSKTLSYINKNNDFFIIKNKKIDEKKILDNFEIKVLNLFKEKKYLTNQDIINSIDKNMSYNKTRYKMSKLMFLCNNKNNQYYLDK